MLTQPEADALLAMEKHRTDETVHSYPGPGIEIKIPLLSVDRREEFLLDIRRHRIEIVVGGKYQTRARAMYPLARLCFARPHRNPDGTEVPAIHLYVYRQGEALQWAYALDPRQFSNPDDRQALLDDFMRYTSITRPPHIQPDVFA